MATVRTRRAPMLGALNWALPRRIYLSGVISNPAGEWSPSRFAT